MALRSRHMRSMVVRARGHLEQAENLCKSVIANAEQLELFQWLAHPYYVRALIARDRGKYDRAEHGYNKACKNCRKPRNKFRLPRVTTFKVRFFTERL